MSELQYGTITDLNGAPVAGALIYIRDVDGALVDTGAANPSTTTSLGYWEAELDQGTYYLTAVKGNDSFSRQLDVCADLLLVRRGIGFVEFDYIQTQDYRQPTHVFTAAKTQALVELSNDADLRTSKRIFTTCTIA